MPHASEESVKSVIPLMNIDLRPSRSESEPAVCWKAPKVTV